MRCPHCSSTIADSEWFCPNCKRGMARQRRRRRATAVGTTVLALAVAGGGVALVRLLPAVRTAAGALPQMEVSAAAVRQEASRFSSGGWTGSGQGAVSVVTVPPVRTFVYLNGGRLLGETPLRNASIPTGRHTLVLWAPSIRGRSTRTVDVDAGQSTLVIENIRQQDQFRDGAGS